MPNTKPAPLDDPGQRTGEGVDSLLPHLQRQSQSQVKVPIKKNTKGDPEWLETEPPKE